MSPYAVGGRRLAHMMLTPRVVDFFETALKSGDHSLNIGDILVTEVMMAAGKSLGQLRAGQDAGATVLAVLRAGEVNASPRGDFTLAAGDRLLALGTSEQLERLEALMATA
jgi:voltage-gated potassium channel